MKKIMLALSIVSVALTVAASPREGHERSQWLGRHGYDHDDVPQASVPEGSSTLALAAIGIVSLGFVAISVNRKKESKAH